MFYSKGKPVQVQCVLKHSWYWIFLQFVRRLFVPFFDLIGSCHAIQTRGKTGTPFMSNNWFPSQSGNIFQREPGNITISQARNWALLHFKFQGCLVRNEKCLRNVPLQTMEEPWKSSWNRGKIYVFQLVSTKSNSNSPSQHSRLYRVFPLASGEWELVGKVFQERGWSSCPYVILR